MRPHAVGLTLAVLVMMGCALYAAALGPPVFPFDDAYITLHNTQSLRSGADLNYGDSSPLHGSTSPAHLLLVVLLSFLLPPVWALEVSLWLAAMAYALGVARLGLTLKATPLDSGLLAIAALLAAQTPHQLLNGLETGLALAAVSWALAFAVTDELRPSIRLAALCGVLPFIRPELAALSALLLGQRWMHFARKSGIRWAASLACREFAVAALTAAPWLIWNAWETGSPFPNTVGAKRLFFAEGCLPPGFKNMWVTGSVCRFLAKAGPLALGLGALVFTSTGRAALLFTASLVASYWLFFPGALEICQQRYLYVLLPLTAFGIGSLLGSQAPWRQRASTVALIAALVYGAAWAPSRFQDHLRLRGLTTGELAPLADWCNRNIPPDAPVLIHDAGYIAYQTRLKLVDLVGLKTPSSVAEHARFTAPSCGRDRAMAIDRIAARADAQYFIVLRDWDAIFELTAGLRAKGWALDMVRRSPNADRLRYDVYRIRNGGPFFSPSSR